MHRLLNTLLVLSLVAAAPALAAQEPPTRAGRVSFLSGNLAFHMPGQTEWSAAALNYPVATGAAMWTDAESRAELRIGADTLAITGNTELDVLELSEQITRISLPQGRVYLHLRRVGDGHNFEVEIPRGRVQLLQPGSYDIDAGTADQPAHIAVYEGSAQFAGGGIDIGIKAGDVAVLNGLTPVTATLERAAADAFIEWCRSREYDEKRLAAPYHVSPDMTGYAELDSHGRWDTAADYGEVWYPDVPGGWAPYTEGRWVWIEPWGWTWVDDAPWGFAPSHYGRWAFVGERWCWVPGAFEPSPVYAPALVGFLGGPGVGLYVTGAIGPQIGWVPLAPGEIYWPSYRAGPDYIRRVNAANVANINNIQIRQAPVQLAGTQFANRRFATIVPQRVFARAGNVGPAALHPAGAALEHVAVTPRAPQIRPAPMRSLPGPVALGTRGQSPPSLGPQGVTGGGPGHFPGPSHAAAPPPSAAGFGGRQPGQLPRQWHGGPPAQSGAPIPPRSVAGQERQPTWRGATHPHTPAPAFRPPQALRPPLQAFHAPAQAFHPPPQAFHPPPQAFHAPAQAFHPSAQIPQQIAHAPPAPQGAAAPRGGGGKGGKHD